MKIPREAVCIIFLIAVGTLSACGDQPESDPFAVDARVVATPKNPNHLEPLPAYDPDGYDQAVFRSLIGRELGELWMIGKPSFSPEYAVILRHKIKYAKSVDPFNREIVSEKWVVEYVKANKMI